MAEWRDDPRGFLRRLFEAAVASAQPSTVVPEWVQETLGGAAGAPARRRAREQAASGRPVTVLGAGKASAAMAQAFEESWPGPVQGAVVTRYGHGAPCRRVEVLEAAHPVPDANSVKAASHILEAARGLGEGDLAVCLISGGGSALLALPAPGVTLEEKQAATAELLRSGASIHEINAVRKHLSLVKGGRLALACHPAPVLTLLISDVPGDDPATIASGPTVPDPTTVAQAAGVIRKYGLSNQDALIQALRETPKPGDPAFALGEATVVASPMMALRAAARLAESQGLPARILSDRIEGPAAEAGEEHARLAMEALRERRPLLLLSGGETTVRVAGGGRGGRNVEFLAAFAAAAGGTPGLYALAADTDGIDGTDAIAGATADPSTLARAARLGLDLEAFRKRNDCHGFFERLGDSVVTGPTRTNVNDFRAVLVLPESSLPGNKSYTKASAGGMPAES